MKFNIKLKQRRLEKSMTLEEVANKVGVGKATVQRWESGEIESPRFDKLTAVAKALDVPISYFYDDLDAAVANEFPWYVPGEGTIDEQLAKFKASIPADAMPIEARRIPILGTIHCGEPTFSDEDFSGYATVGTKIHCDFALRAKGDSMIGARIHSGDIVFIRKQPDVLDGEIAAVILDDETTLKRVYKFPDGTSELRAENPAYKPIRIGKAGEARNVRILGKAVAFQADVV